MEQAIAKTPKVILYRFWLDLNDQNWLPGHGSKKPSREGQS